MGVATMAIATCLAAACAATWIAVLVISPGRKRGHANWRRVRAHVHEPQGYNIGLRSFEEVESWSLGKVVKFLPQYKNTIRAMAQPGIYDLSTDVVDEKWCSLSKTLTTGSQQTCMEWRQLHKASQILFALVICSTVALCCGALCACLSFFGKQCRNKWTGRTAVKIYFGIGSALGSLGLAIYSAMTWSFYDDRGSTMDLLYFAALLNSILSWLPMIFLSIADRVGSKAAFEEEIAEAYGSMGMSLQPGQYNDGGMAMRV